MIFDHRVPAESPKTASNQKKVREFVGAQGVGKFHDIRGDVGGICHQILPENGYVRPGYVVVGTDSHTTSHGALGAFAFGIGATEMASVWALGSVLNVEVPPDHQGGGEGPLQEVRRAEGPDPAPDRQAQRAGRELQGAGVPRRDHPQDVHLRPAGALQHGGRSRRHRRHRPGGRGDGALPARRSRRDGPDRASAAGRGRGLRERHRDQRVQAAAADRLPAHGGQREADRPGGRQEGQPDRHRLLHQRAAR